MMKAWLFAHNHVGKELFRFIAAEYPEDIHLVVTIGENAISAEAKKQGYVTTLYSSLTKGAASEKYGVPDIGILLWWPAIIKKELISVASHGFINIHTSFLPHNRGKHGNFWALVEQCPFGVSIHMVTPEIDSGDVIAKKEIPYSWEDTGETLYYKARSAIMTLFKESYGMIRTLRWQKIPQDLQTGSYHASKELEAASEIHLDASYKGRDLLNLLRARTFSGYPACWFEEHGKRYEAKIQIIRKHS